jgi:hypothetical protein
MLREYLVNLFQTKSLQDIIYQRKKTAETAGSRPSCARPAKLYAAVRPEERAKGPTWGGLIACRAPDGEDRKQRRAVDLATTDERRGGSPWGGLGAKELLKGRHQGSPWSPRICRRAPGQGLGRWRAPRQHGRSSTTAAFRGLGDDEEASGSVQRLAVPLHAHLRRAGGLLVVGEVTGELGARMDATMLDPTSAPGQGWGLD